MARFHHGVIAFVLFAAGAITQRIDPCCDADASDMNTVDRNDICEGQQETCQRACWEKNLDTDWEFNACNTTSMQFYCACYYVTNTNEMKFVDLVNEMSQYKWSFWGGTCEWLKAKCPDTCKSLVCGTRVVDIQLVRSTSSRRSTTTTRSAPPTTTLASTTFASTNVASTSSPARESESQTLGVGNDPFSHTQTQSSATTDPAGANNDSVTPSRDKALTPGAKAGIATGVAIVGLVLGFALRRFLRRQWRRKYAIELDATPSVRPPYDPAGLEVANPQDPMLYRRSELDSLALGTEHPIVKYRHSFQEVQSQRVELADVTTKPQKQAPSELPDTDVALLHADGQLSGTTSHVKTDHSKEGSETSGLPIPNAGSPISPQLSPPLSPPAVARAPLLTLPFTNQERPSRLSIEIMRELNWK